MADDNDVQVVDVGSLNGTYVKRQPVDAAKLVNGTYVKRQRVDAANWSMATKSSSANLASRS